MVMSPAAALSPPEEFEADVLLPAEVDADVLLPPEFAEDVLLLSEPPHPASIDMDIIPTSAPATTLDNVFFFILCLLLPCKVFEVSIAAAGSALFASCRLQYNRIHTSCGLTAAPLSPPRT